MKINLSEEVRKNTALSHVVISCLTNAITTELIKARTTGKDIVCEIKLVVDDHELDLHAFVERWQNQVSRTIKEKIKEKATKIIEEKFRDIDEIFYDLKERLKPEIEKRIEDWEREADEESERL